MYIHKMKKILTWSASLMRRSENFEKGGVKKKFHLFVFFKIKKKIKNFVLSQKLFLLFFIYILKKKIKIIF